MTKKRVLIPLDGSAFSRRILSYVIELLDPTHVELILFRLDEQPKAIHIHEGNVNLDIYVDEVEASMRHQLKQEMVDDYQMLKDAGFSTHVEIEFDHDVAGQIVDFVKRQRVDLVAMTTHGRTGVQRLLTGSVADYVLRHVDVPVLMLRPFEQKGESKPSLEEQETMLMT